MVYTPLRSAIEIVGQLLAASIGGWLAYRDLFYAQQDGVLLSVVTGVLVLLFVQGLYSLRNTFITGARIYRRYGVQLSMNEVSFLRRTGEGGTAVLKTAEYPCGLAIAKVDAKDWELRRWESRQELARG